MRESQKNGHAADAALIHWSPQMLRTILADEMPDAQVIVVSNREPYIHDLSEDGVRLVVPASGLVSALEPITRACAGTWIAYGGGSADRLTVDGNDRIQVPPDKPSYTLRRVWLSEEEHRGTISASPTKGCGRCAISPSRGRCSALPTGRPTRRSTASSPTP